MNKPIVINKTHTSCQDCIFADYYKHTQEGCFIGALTNLRNYGYEIIDAVNGEIENGQIIPGTENEFFIINNTICTKKRTKDWEFANYLMGEQFRAVDKEIELKYTAIIFEDNNPFGVAQTVQSLLEQSPAPLKIIVIRPYDSGTGALGYIGLFNDENISWKVQNFQEEYTKEEIADMVIFHVKTPIYAIFHAGFTPPRNMFSDLNCGVNETFFNFILLSPNSKGNGEVGMAAAYMAFNGNMNKSFEQKIKESNPQCLYQTSKIIKDFPE